MTIERKAYMRTRFGILIFLSACAQFQQALAQSSKLEDLRTTMELVYMCAVKSGSVPDVRTYFLETRDTTLQREWNKAIKRVPEQLKQARDRGGNDAIRAAQRYDLSCTLIDTTMNLPIGLQSALHK